MSNDTKDMPAGQGAINGGQGVAVAAARDGVRDGSDSDRVPPTDGASAGPLGFPQATTPLSRAHVGIDGPDVNGVGGVRIVAEDISLAWVAAFGALMRPGIQSLEPLVVTVSGFGADGSPRETVGVTSLINSALHAAHETEAKKKGRRPKHGPLTVASAANTIFPQSLWVPGMNRHEFYAKYMRMLPRLRLDSRNRRGTYFARLINYGRGPEDGNQLENMFSAFAKRVKRTSAYQASIADPATDMTKTPFLGFPCLQQIAVHPSERTGTLSITGFYATQYLFERGYGNFLGLCRLGRFISHEMGLRFTRMTCVASHAPVESIGKARGRALLAAAEQVIAEQHASETGAGSSATRLQGHSSSVIGTHG